MQQVILKGTIDMREFERNLLPYGEENGYQAPQLIVHGLSYPNLIRAFIAARQPDMSGHIVEDGPFRLTPERFQEEEEWEEGNAEREDRDEQLLLSCLLHVCSCGYSDCYSTRGMVRRFALDGQEGLLIERAWNPRFETKPYPVPPVFFPWMAWVRHYYGDTSGPVHRNKLAMPTAEVNAILGGDARNLLRQYEIDHQRLTVTMSPPT